MLILIISEVTCVLEPQIHTILNYEHRCFSHIFYIQNFENGTSHVLEGTNRQNCPRLVHRCKKCGERILLKILLPCGPMLTKMQT